jgi:hypothetical protein
LRVWNKDAAHCATTCLCRGLCISAGPVPACGCCALRLFLPRAPVSAACGVSRFAAAARDRRGVAGLACARRVRGANADRTRSGRPSSPYRALPGRAQRDQRSHRFVIKHSLESFRLLASKKLLLSLLVPARLAARSTAYYRSLSTSASHPADKKYLIWVAPLCGEGPSSGSLCALEKSKPLTSYGT